MSRLFQLVQDEKTRFKDLPWVKTFVDVLVDTKDLPSFIYVQAWKCVKSFMLPTSDEFELVDDVFELSFKVLFLFEGHYNYNMIVFTNV